VAAVDFESLLSSWELSLRAERKSASTVKSYGDGVRRYLRWWTESSPGDAPTIEKRAVRGFIADLLDADTAPATARSRHLALCRFSAWLAEEGELATDPLFGSKPPKIDVKVTPTLTGEQLSALIAACKGPGLRERRDEALIRFMVETGARAGEVIDLRTTHVDLPRGIATITRGKGGKGRIVPFGAQTGTALDRYLRARRSHPRAATPAFWLGPRQGRGFTYYALHKALGHRAELAGIAEFHPHVLRHTAATRWLAAGGSEGGLMAVAGWTRRDMIDRYTAATAAERAADEARTHGLGDL